MPRIDLTPRDLAIVCDLLRRHVPSRRVVVFGSCATGRAKPFSDLDLAILGDAAVPSRILAALADDFDESSVPFKVDIVDWATTTRSFKDIIERDAIPLQDGAKGETSP